MRIITLSILLFLMLSICQPCLAGEGQAWDAVHVTGVCVGTLYLSKTLHMPYWKAAATMFALGLCWEYFGDEFYSRGYYGRRHNEIFDRRGFSGRDILRNGFGIAISIPIR